MNSQNSNFLLQTSRNDNMFHQCHNIATITLYPINCNNSFNEVQDVIIKLSCRNLFFINHSFISQTLEFIANILKCYSYSFV